MLGSWIVPIENRSYFSDQHRSREAKAAAMVESGPLMDVAVGIPNMALEGLERCYRTVGEPLRGPALLDTGAVITTVDFRVLEQLKAEPIREASMGSSRGIQKHRVYRVCLGFTSTDFGLIGPLEVMDGDIAYQRIVALIGRDVLKDFLLIYNGPMGQVTLAK